MEVASASGRRPPRVIAADSDGYVAWSPDGATIAFTRTRVFFGGSDLWTVRADGGDVRQVTTAFPTGVGYEDPNWTAGSVPAPTQVHPELLTLTPSSEQNVAWVDRIHRSGMPDSVAYTHQIVCNPDAETTSNSFIVWTPATNNLATQESGSHEFVSHRYNYTPNVPALLRPLDLVPDVSCPIWLSPGASGAEDRSWSSEAYDVDIGYENDLGELKSDGSMLTFQSTSDSVGRQLWRIADGSPPRAVPIPLPPDATDTADVANGRVAVYTSAGGLVVLTPDGTVACRLPPLGTRAQPAEAKLGDDVIGIVTGTTLQVYQINDASLLAQFPLAHTSGSPYLLSLSDSYATYTSGIELHLLRLRDGKTRYSTPRPAEPRRPPHLRALRLRQTATGSPDPIPSPNPNLP